MMTKKKIAGWREWVKLPLWSDRSIIAKLDTGAKTSAIHAEEIVYLKRRGVNWVQFRVHLETPKRGTGLLLECPLLGRRRVRSSVGIETMRPVVKTTLVIGREQFEFELTLVNRDFMEHRLLLGRAALKHGFLVDSQYTFLLGKKKKKKLRKKTPVGLNE